MSDSNLSAESFALSAFDVIYDVHEFTFEKNAAVHSLQAEIEDLLATPVMTGPMMSVTTERGKETPEQTLTKLV
ncbi:MAG: hypothetical protein EON58_18010 [Alphaproteobacteria bacterium]|nr:MAG: hypothetical protein EON58_18010 [Alphaproteobacteria bacterium]